MTKSSVSILVFLLTIVSFSIHASEKNAEFIRDASSSSTHLKQAKLATNDTKPNQLPSNLASLDCMIEPHQVIEVATAASGIIGKINVNRGDIVKQGDVLAMLDSGVEQVNVSLSRARAKFSKKKFTRMQEVFNKKGISDHAKDEAEIEKHLAALEYRRSLEVLKMRTIKSPLAGVVVEKFLAPGEYAEQEKIIKIAQIDPLNVEIIAPVSLFGKAKPGMEVLVYPEAPVGGEYKARVTVIDRVIDPASGTFGIRLEMPNRKHKIPSGVKCRANFAAD